MKKIYKHEKLNCLPLFHFVFTCKQHIIQYGHTVTQHTNIQPLIIRESCAVYGNFTSNISCDLKF